MNLIEVLRSRNPETDPDCHEAADRIERLEAAVRRSLSWLSSYPGGGAIGAWEQAHDALEPLSLEAVPTKNRSQFDELAETAPEPHGTDPQSFCPWCQRMHDAPEFFEYARKTDD